MQLSQQQLNLLMWLEKREKHITQGGRRKSKLGIRWNSKRFFKEAPTQSQIASISRAIRSLERRGLIDIERGKKRLRFIRISKAGRHAIDPNTLIFERSERAERASRYARRFYS